MLLGIDLGTSSLKAVLFDPACGTIAAQAKVPIRTQYPRPGWAEMDPEALWQALLETLAQLGRNRPDALAAVRGVGLSTIFPALVPMDREGRALRPALLYSDHRSLPQATRFAQAFGSEALELRTGNRFVPGTTTLPGILWLREEEPGIFARTHVFGQIETYLVHRLTGEITVDASHQSLSGLTAAGDELRYDEALLAAADLDPTFLPRPVESASVSGQVTAAAARATGLPAGIPVVAGCGDAPLATLGGGVCDPGKLFVSAGTTDCLMISAARPSGNPLFCNIHAPVPGLWVVNGTMSTAGAAVKWFHEEFMVCSLEEMTRQAETSAPGAGGVVFLPYLQGERTPCWDPQARGQFFGLGLTTGRAEACRAVFEGIACAWKQIVGLLEAECGLRAPEIMAVGGGSTNPFLNRIKATLLDRPVRALAFTEITSLGAAMIAGLGAGVYASAEEACTRTAPLRTSQIFEPVPAWREALEHTYGLYTRLYPALRPLFAD
jgi:xylulokinase